MDIKVFDVLPQDAKDIRIAVFVDEQDFTTNLTVTTMPHCILWHTLKTKPWQLQEFF